MNIAVIIIEDNFILTPVIINILLQKDYSKDRMDDSKN